MLDNFLKKILSSEIENVPFPHLFIKGIFKEEDYIKFLKNMPKKEEYVQINKTGTVSKNYPAERYKFDIHPKNILNFKGEKFSFFEELLKSFSTNSFFNSVTSKFKNTIDERIKNFSNEEKEMYGPELKFECLISLVKDYSKFKLGAHTDTPRKFLTFLFYLPKDESMKDIGTSLFSIKDSMNIPSYKMHFDEEATDKYFNESRRIPFVPNSVLIFPRTNFSFHGVSSINIDAKERNLLLLNFFFKNNE